MLKLRFNTFLSLVTALFLNGCAVVERTGIALLYKKADLKSDQILKDISFEGTLNETPSKRLNLFLPHGSNWLVVIFVHGGNWDSGNKDLKFGGADVYGNIGRFLAVNGIGTAVINYRLQPLVAWREQVRDVAEAVAWVHLHVSDYGGNPQRIFLMGHSAGAQLACHVALNPAAWLTGNADFIRGVISVSGAGLDLTDAETYELGENISFYEKRFHLAGEEDWQRQASPLTYAGTGAPPFLILYGEREKKSLKRQSALLNQVLTREGGANRLLVVPGQNHSRIVLTLSRDDKTAGPALLDFIRSRGRL